MTEFDAAFADIPEIIEAQRLCGAPDYLIGVATTDLSSYEHLYESMPTHLRGCAASTRPS